MSKFKGTKSKWSIDDYNGKGSVIDIIVNINNDEDGQIAQVYSLNEMCYKEFQNDEHKANALLISKAPELLEMLEKVINNSDVPNEIFDEAKKLIKKSTTL